ncbi:MAG: hypothetical protein ACXACU_19810, partial [Candidatus Hodarchaeales archaeon]
PKTEEYFRFTPYQGKRRFKLHPITKEESTSKLLQIIGKQTVKGGKFQLTFHDGRNHLLDPKEKQEIALSEFSLKDSVLFDLETKTIKDHYPFAVDNTGIIMGGHNAGFTGIITQIESQSGRKMRSIRLRTEEEEIETLDKHIFIIGKEKSVIDIPKPERGLQNEA